MIPAMDIWVRTMRAAFVCMIVVIGFHVALCQAATPQGKAASKRDSEYGQDLGVSAGLLQKILEQKTELIRFKIAVLAYNQRNGRLPDNPQQAVAPYTGLDSPPKDLFRQGKPIIYLLSQDRQEAVFYSVGPDGMDDKAQADLSKPKDNGPTPNGDMIDRVNLREMTRYRESNKELAQKLHDKLVAIRSKTGRDNAMIYYIEAGWLAYWPNDRSFWTNYESDLIAKTLRDGWSEQSKPLIGVLARYEPSLNLARKGILLDHASNDLCLEEPSQTPNYLAAQTTGKLFCILGRLLESKGKPVNAMDNYLAALTMGRDIGVPETPLVGGLVSVAALEIALNQIIRLAPNASLDRATLERAAARLKTVEATQGRFSQWLADDNRLLDAAIAHDKARNAERNTTRSKQTANNMDEMVAGLKTIQEWNKSRFSIPYWEREAKGYGPADYEKLTQKLTENQKTVANDLAATAEVRNLHAKSRLLEARIVVALEIYKRDKGAYPDTLRALVPGLLEALPIDPFSGKPFLYQRPSSGESYRVWSIGPDLKDDFAKINYDPTNGIYSSGDVTNIQ